MSDLETTKNKYAEYMDKPTKYPVILDDKVVETRQEWVDKKREVFSDYVSLSWIRKDRREGDGLITNVSWTKDICGVCGFIYGVNSKLPVAAYFVSLVGTPIKDTDNIEHKDTVKISVCWGRIGEYVIENNIRVIPLDSLDMTKDEYDVKFGYFDSFKHAMEIVK